jgi:hypothetical protein
MSSNTECLFEIPMAKSPLYLQVLITTCVQVILTNYLQVCDHLSLGSCDHLSLKLKKKWKIFKGMLIKTTFLCVDKCKILQCKYFLFLFNCLKSFKHVSLQDLGDKKKRLILGLPNQTTHCSSVRHSLAIMRMPSLVTHV